MNAGTAPGFGIGLSLTLPVLAAPMAGGPTTPALVVAAARAGGLGFIAGGYRTADELAGEIRAVSAQTAVFGVNLFAPNPVPVNLAAYGGYRESLRPDAERFGAGLPSTPLEDDDAWAEKIQLLVDLPVPVVSFTFGVPDAASLAAVRSVGSFLVQTVTSSEEAAQAADAGFDALAVQGPGAGGHFATFTPGTPPSQRSLVDLISEVRHRVDIPILAAGGVASAADVVAAIRRGAAAVMVGTSLLLSPESGASMAHRSALRDGRRGDTIMTRAFTGRPARGLRNAFYDRYDAIAPSGYPAVHHLTRSLRKLAASENNPEFVNLWAGVGYRAAAELPAAEILRRLASEV